MNLENTINEDIKAAMFAKDKVSLDALRAVKSALLLLKTEKGAAEEVTEDAEIKLLQRLVKQRKDAAELYQQQERTDLYQDEVDQLEIISKYLPQQMSKEEITVVVKQLIAEHGIASVKDMGKLMGLASKLLAGKADNKKISEIVKNLLS
ncbi:MAG: GatB/YqeY domain-containing protein [Bacteroidales bacterium]|nr:GatB/YqeY domain-containing protein [Bacteroidales bacterium]